MKELLDQLKDNKSRIKISGRGLAYAVDLEGKTQFESPSLEFFISGNIRFAILNSEGTFLSKYNFTEDVLLQKHEIDFKKINFRESYELSKNSFIFEKRGRSTSQIEGFTSEVLDPAPLVFKMALLDQNQDYDERGTLLVGGKIKNFHFRKSGSDFQVHLNDKPLFYGVYKANEAHLVVNSLKIKLKVGLA